jgi:hypothetical protein
MIAKQQMMYPEPDLLANSHNKRALDSIIHEEANKRADRTHVIGDISKRYGRLMIVPNIAAGIVGYIAGGVDGSLQAMRDVSLTAVPFILTYALVDDLHRKNKGIDTPEYIDIKKHQLKGLLRKLENQPDQIMLAGAKTVGNAALYYTLSALSEKLTGMDFNQAYVTLAGAGAIWASSILDYFDGANLRWKIKSEAQEITESNSSGVVSLSDLEDMANTFKHLTLSQDRDIPLKSLDIDSDHIMCVPTMDDASMFIVTGRRGRSKTETIEYISKLISGKDENGVILFPSFYKLKLDDFLRSPQGYLSNVLIRPESGDSAVYYYFGADFEDNLHITIQNNKDLGLVQTLFRDMNGRDIHFDDFDKSFMEEYLSRRENNKDKPFHYCRATRMPTSTILEELELDRPMQSFSTTFEPGAEDMDSVQHLVIKAYDTVSPRLLNQPAKLGSSRLGVALEGLLISMIASVDGTGMQLELYAQMEGITKDNAFEIAKGLDESNINLGQVQSGEMGFDEFWEKTQDPPKFFDNFKEMQFYSKSRASQIKLLVDKSAYDYRCLRDAMFPYDKASDEIEFSPETNFISYWITFGKIGVGALSPNEIKGVPHQVITLDDTVPMAAMAYNLGRWDHLIASSNMRIRASSAGLKDKNVANGVNQVLGAYSIARRVIDELRNSKSGEIADII